jgi:transposase
MDREEIRKIYHAGEDAVIEFIFRQNEIITLLLKKVKELEDRLNKDSHNSSKPPSSDRLSQRGHHKRNRKSGKKRGGQRGHEGTQMKMVENPDHIIRHEVRSCECCLRSISHVKAKWNRKRQVFDLPTVKFEVTEHQAEIKGCPFCGHVTGAQFPGDITRPAQYGSRIKGIITYLSQYQLLPYERISEFLKDVFEIEVSTGTIYNTNKQAYEAAEKPEEAIKDLLKEQPLLHVDETGVCCADATRWMHVVSTDRLTYLGLHSKRGKEGIEALGIIPGYRGYLMHDFWSSYLSYDCSHLFCNAHLLRELAAIHEDYKQEWASRMIDVLMRAKKITDNREKRLNKNTIDMILNDYDTLVKRGFRSNPLEKNTTVRRGRKKKSKPRNLLERLRDYRDGILGFVYNVSLPFDNNQGERDLRMLKVQQKISGCFRSIEGGLIFARIRGYISTVKKNNNNVLDAIQGLFKNRPFIPEFAE